MQGAAETVLLPASYSATLQSQHGSVDEHSSGTVQQAACSANLHALARALCSHAQVIASLQRQDKLALCQARHALGEVPIQLWAEVHASQRVPNHRIKARTHDYEVGRIGPNDRLQHLNATVEGDSLFPHFLNPPLPYHACSATCRAPMVGPQVMKNTS